MDYERRLDGLREQMTRQRLALVVFGPGCDFQYLTGIPLGRRLAANADGLSGCALVAQTGAPVVVLGEAYAPLAERGRGRDVRILQDRGGLTALCRTILREMAIPPGRAAIGGSVPADMCEAIRTCVPDGAFTSADGLLDALRRIKEPEEVARLRAAATLADEVMAAIVPKVVEGVTQRDLEAEIEHQGRLRGATDVSFPPAAKFTRSGSSPADDPFTYPAQEGLVPGTSIAFDFGFVLDDYCSDFGRSLHFGPADAATCGAYDALRQAVVETVAQMRPGGLRLCDLFPIMEKVLDGLGYGDDLRARLPNGVLGHQIGLEVHENPWINPQSARPLEAGMVMAIEPKLWHPGQYYLRIEDIVLIGPDRAEFLTDYSRTVFQV